jgi:hypothetical protein
VHVTYAYGGRWRYSSINLAVDKESRKLHTAATLTTGKQQLPAWAPKIFWTFLGNEKWLNPAGNRTAISQLFSSVVTILTELSRIRPVEPNSGYGIYRAVRGTSFTILDMVFTGPCAVPASQFWIWYLQGRARYQLHNFGYGIYRAVRGTNSTIFSNFIINALTIKSVIK